MRAYQYLDHNKKAQPMPGSLQLWFLMNFCRPSCSSAQKIICTVKSSHWAASGFWFLFWVGLFIYLFFSCSWDETYEVDAFRLIIFGYLTTGAAQFLRCRRELPGGMRCKTFHFWNTILYLCIKFMQINFVSIFICLAPCPRVGAINAPAGWSVIILEKLIFAWF